MVDEPDHEPEPTEANTAAGALPDGSVVPSGWSDVRRYLRTLGVSAVATTAVVGVAQAQSSSGICASPFAQTMNTGVPLAVGILMACAIVLAYLLNIYAGLKRDPNKAQEIKDWRNRSGLTAVSTPILAWIIVRLAEASGYTVASCITLVPF